MSDAWDDFLLAARRGEPAQVPVALIVDSPWLPGYTGLDTRDYFLFDERWFAIHTGLCERFPGAVWLPGCWVEYGMAAEPSAFGVKMRFHADSPPSIEPLVDDLARLFMGALMVVGLAAAHRFKAEGRLNGAWLWAIYVLLVLAAPVMVAALAGWGFVDNWLRSQRAAQSA